MHTLKKLSVLLWATLGLAAGSHFLHTSLLPTPILWPWTHLQAHKWQLRHHSVADSRHYIKKGMLSTTMVHVTSYLWNLADLLRRFSANLLAATCKCPWAIRGIIGEYSRNLRRAPTECSAEGLRRTSEYVPVISAQVFTESRDRLPRNLSDSRK